MVRASLTALLAMGLAAGCNPDTGPAETQPHDVPETATPSASPGPDSTALPPPTLETTPGRDATDPAASADDGILIGDSPAHENWEDGMACDASKAEWMIGETPTDELLERGAADAGVEIARYIRHDEAVTMEYHPSRLNVSLDENGIIARVNCG